MRAKQRSIHNNYLTFPLLFMMLSNHFPSAYGHHLNWLVLIAVMVGGAGVRHFMNMRYLGEGRQMIPIAWLAPAGIMAAIAIAGLLVITRIAARPEVDVTYAVGFARAQEIIVQRCVPCHSSHPTDPVLDRTWSGEVAPAMIDAIWGRPASQDMASSSSVWPCSVAKASRRSTTSKAASPMAASRRSAGNPAMRVPSGGSSPRRYLPVSIPLARGK